MRSRVSLKEPDEVEHLAGERIGQQLHLLVNQIGDGHPGLLVSRRRLEISYPIRGARARPPPDDRLREAISFVTR